MKKVLKVLGILLGVIILVIALVATYNQFAPIPSYEVNAPDLKVEPDSTRLARGAKIVGTTCTFCHSGQSDKLDGKLLEDDPAFGTIYTANITQHPEHGIGKYTDGELLYLFRTGIKRNGQLAMPMMSRLPHISDEDIYSIIAYLRSDAPELKASEQAWPEPKLGFVGKALSRLVFKPLPYEGQSIPPQDTQNLVVYGKYLATDMLECYNCHSASFETNNVLEPEKSAGYFGGGNKIEMKGKGLIYSPNITMHKEKGIGAWTEAQFVEAVKNRKRPNGASLNPIMPDYSKLSDQEIKAIWAYLQTVPVLDNDVFLIASGEAK
ncbi:MAG: c-type cytochrome [Saprospiraceae bacterium]